MAERLERCETCRWWDSEYVFAFDLEVLTGEAMGGCRRYPPPIKTGDEDEYIATWLCVGANDWCGEWKGKEEPK